MTRKVVPDDRRVAAIYEKLTGEPMTRGMWKIDQRDFAQKIVYVEETCHSVLDAIKTLENCNSDDQLSVKHAVKALRTEFDFLNTLQLR